MSDDAKERLQSHLEGGPIELLFERADPARFELPADLVAAYGGPLGFAGPRVIANFVQSVDGVVALPEKDESGHIISGGSDADRFVMGMLRACADVVMVGAGTYRKASKAIFDAPSIYPRFAEQFATLRKTLGLAPRPRFVLVTDVADIDVEGPALESALVITTARGAATLEKRLPASATLIALAPGKLRLTDVVALLRQDGARVVLTEGGPTLVAQLVAEGALDELFVTTSPKLFGRFPNDGRKALFEGIDLAGTSLELVGIRRQGSYLFSRYALAKRDKWA